MKYCSNKDCTIKNAQPYSSFADNKGIIRKFCSQCRLYFKKYAKEYRLKNKKRINDLQREWYINNIDKERKRSREWRRKHRLKCNESSKKWRSKNKDKCKVYKNNYRTRKYNNKGSFSEQEWKDLKLFFNNKCVCCNKRKKLEPDHIIPITKKGHSYIDNIQPLCRSCNNSKYNNIIDFRGLYD